MNCRSSLSVCRCSPHRKHYEKYHSSGGRCQKRLITFCCFFRIDWLSVHCELSFICRFLTQMNGMSAPLFVQKRLILPLAILLIKRRDFILLAHCWNRNFIFLPWYVYLSDRAKSVSCLVYIYSICIMYTFFHLHVNMNMCIKWSLIFNPEVNVVAGLMRSILCFVGVSEFNLNGWRSPANTHKYTHGGWWWMTPSPSTFAVAFALWFPHCLSRSHTFFLFY